MRIIQLTCPANSDKLYKLRSINNIETNKMSTVSSASFKVILALSALLLLSACGSELTSIDAPESVEAGQQFQVSVSNQFFDDDGIYSPADSPEGALVYGVLIPAGWSANPLANYQGTWDGAPVDLELALQSGIPETNFVEYLVDNEGPVELIEYLSLSDCSTVLEDAADEIAGFQFLFFQTTGDLSGGPDPQDGDTGVFTFQLTPGNPGAEDAIAVVHGLLIGGPIADGAEDFGVANGEIVTDVLACSWYPDVAESQSQGEFIPDAETAGLVVFGSASATSVPVLGGAMIAVLALLLAGAGILVGRRKSEHTG